MKISKLIKVLLLSASALILGISCKHGHGGGGGGGEVYAPAPSSGGSSGGSSSSSSGTTGSNSVSSGGSSTGTLVPAIGTPPPGFVAVAGREGGDGDIVPMFACDHEVTQEEYGTYCINAAIDTFGKGSKYPAYAVTWYNSIIYCNLRSMTEGLTPCYSIGGDTNPANWIGIQELDSGGIKYSPPELSHAPDHATEELIIRSWEGVVYNANANGYRLPTSAEWEYLAKGGFEQKNYIYSGSNTIDDVAWYRGNSGHTTHEVKGKAPNSLGLYDMSGNVSEWCWDSRQDKGPNHFVRNGSWDTYEEGCVISWCTFQLVSILNAGLPSMGNGFRVVRTAQ